MKFEAKGLKDKSSSNFSPTNAAREYTAVSGKRAANESSERKVTQEKQLNVSKKLKANLFNLMHF